MTSTGGILLKALLCSHINRRKNCIMPTKLFSCFFLFSFILSIAEAIKIAKHGCPNKCGDFSIPYPFGIGSKCSLDRLTEVSCDSTFTPPKLFFTHSNPHEIVELSILTTIGLPVDSAPFVRIKNNISRICSDGSGVNTSRYNLSSGSNSTSFFLSGDRNQFTVIGCGMYGKLEVQSLEEDWGNLTKGCTTLCDKMENTVDRRCPGAGCCQIYLDKTRSYSIHLEALNASDITRDRCGSAFVTDKEEYKFRSSDIEFLEDITMRIDFRIRNQTCKDARKDPSSFACKGKSECYDSFGGYYCQCKHHHYPYSQGNPFYDDYEDYYNMNNIGVGELTYEGNPYLNHGCQDINECEHPWNHCTYKCFNTKGSFRCFSKRFFKGLFLGVGLVLLLLASGGIYYIKRKQLQRLSEKVTRLDARLLLIQEISSHATIFTAKKLQLATNNYHENRILGEGGYGKVYKGILPDQSIIAIKTSKISEKSQFEEFINEVAILAKIDHRNIVKLLGCSVETERPLLVYEFVSNGTLYDHIFKKGDMPYSSMSWETRLRIAAEIAAALAYLHFAASVPIIHRDIKSSNILLDDNFTAKVADFGVSRLNHLDETAISTLVKGTPGYLDPEYMQTSQLTEKSDVFSFGVVLAELLTGRKPISFERPEEERSLAIYFTMSMKEERMLQILEEGMVNEENIKQIQAVAALAQWCLHFTGEERPSMKEVASKLEALQGFSKKHSTSQKSNEERPGFTSKQENLSPPSMSYDGASTSSVVEFTMSTMIPR